jgi:hypothetical protein
MKVLILFIYLVISISIGIIDVVLVKSQYNYLSTVPNGDIGYYVVPKKIIGIHNVILFPSLFVIGIFRILGKLVEA